MFQGRPDALGPYSDAGKYKGDNPAGHPGDDPLVANGVAGESGATNLGPRSQELVDDTKDLSSTGSAGRAADFRPGHHLGQRASTPTSRPQDAQAEIPMVSRATGLSAATLQRLISQQTQGMQLGFLGSPYVNVLQLNEALAKLKT